MKQSQKTQIDLSSVERLEILSLNKRSLAAFWVLATEKRPLTGLEIADYLGISPRNIDRTLKPLRQSKMVRSGKIPGTPNKTRYFTPPIEYVERMYISAARKEFRMLFQDAYLSRR